MAKQLYLDAITAGCFFPVISEQRAIFFEGQLHDQLVKASSFNFYRVSKVSDTLEQLINIRPTYKS